MKFDKTQKRALVFVAGLLGLSWYMGNQFEKADMMRSEGKRPCCSKPSMYFTMRGLSCRNCSKEDRIYRPAKEDSFNQMRSEADGYAYAYNEGHSDSRKDDDYQPVITSGREEARFRKILKQRAENFEDQIRYGEMSASKIKELEKYIKKGGQALDYHELPYHIQRELEILIWAENGLEDSYGKLIEFIHNFSKMGNDYVTEKGKKYIENHMTIYHAEEYVAETMTPSEVNVKVTKDVTPKGSKIIVEECVDIQAHKADATANFYRVRFRDPSEMSNFRVPAWAARAANTMGSKYYDVAGSKVTMGQDKSGNWKIQSVMIPKRANVDVDLALKIANHIQDRLEKEGKWAPKKCQDNERVLVIR